MFSKNKITVFTAFCIVFLLSSFVSAQISTTPKSPEKSATPAKPTPTPAAKDSKIEFPEIEGWEKGEIQEYPTPELGYSIPYQSIDGGTVTIYVYNGGKKSIPDGVTGKLLKSEIDQAKSDIIQIGEMGRYQNVKEVKSEIVTLGGNGGETKALYSLFSFSVGGREVDSEIYLFGYQGNFIKIRATRPKSKDESVKAALNSLLTQMDNTFSK